MPPNKGIGFGNTIGVKGLFLVTCDFIFRGPLFLLQIIVVTINRFIVILMLS